MSVVEDEGFHRLIHATWLKYEIPGCKFFSEKLPSDGLPVSLVASSAFRIMFTRSIRGMSSLLPASAYRNALYQALREIKGGVHDRLRISAGTVHDHRYVDIIQQCRIHGSDSSQGRQQIQGSQ